MKLSGTLAENLGAAIESARRFRGRSVHKETLLHWEELLAYARERQREGNSDPRLSGLVSKLQSELARRQNAA
jgi:hypothetical protein